MCVAVLLLAAFFVRCALRACVAAALRDEVARFRAALRKCVRNAALRVARCEATKGEGEDEEEGKDEEAQEDE